MYRKHLKNIPVSPLLSFISADVGEVYTELAIREDMVNKFNLSSEAKTVNGYKDIFVNTTDGEYYNNIFVVGDAGKGKTTWCYKLIRTWLTASDRKSEDMTEDEKIISQFFFPFFISMRNSKTDSSVISMIEQQLFPYDSEMMDVARSVLEFDGRRCLIILDGLDEWSGPKKSPYIDQSGLPAKFENPFITVLTTSRPWKMEELRLKESQVDQAVEIIGIDQKNLHSFVENIVSTLNKYNNKNLTVFQFLEEIEKVTQSGNIDAATLKSLDFVVTPILLQIMVCVWYEFGKLEGNISRLYFKLVEILIRRSIKLERLQTCSFDECHGGTSPGLFKDYPSCTKFSGTLEQLGNLAFNTLFTNSKDSSLIFTEDSLKAYLSKNNMDISLNVGVLTKSQVVGSIFEKQFTCDFLHKSMQEFFAALHLTCLDRQKMQDAVKQMCHKPMKEYANVLQFLCAFGAEIALPVLEELLLQEREHWEGEIMFACFKKVYSSALDMSSINMNVLFVSNAFPVELQSNIINYFELANKNLLVYFDGQVALQDQQIYFKDRTVFKKSNKSSTFKNATVRLDGKTTQDIELQDCFMTKSQIQMLRKCSVHSLELDSGLLPLYTHVQLLNFNKVQLSDPLLEPNSSLNHFRSKGYSKFQEVELQACKWTSNKDIEIFFARAKHIYLKDVQITIPESCLLGVTRFSVKNSSINIVPDKPDIHESTYKSGSLLFQNVVFQKHSLPLLFQRFTTCSFDNVDIDFSELSEQGQLQLNKLMLHDCVLSTAGKKQMKSSFTSLTHLELKHCPLLNAEIMQFLKMVQQLETLVLDNMLVQLDLSCILNVSNLTIRGSKLQFQITGKHGLQKLKTIELDHCLFDSSAVSLFKDTLLLESLAITNTDMSIDMSSMHNLSSLNVTNSTVKMEHLKKPLITKLSSILLDNCNISKQMVNILVKSSDCLRRCVVSYVRSLEEPDIFFHYKDFLVPLKCPEVVIMPLMR